MIGFVVRRFGQAVVVAWLVVTAVFVLLHLLPGDQAHAILGNQVRNPGLYTIYDRENGLDQPAPVQYLYFLHNLVVNGEIATIPPGFSPSPFSAVQGYPSQEPLVGIVTGPLPPTLFLLLIAYAVTLAVSFPLGVYLGFERSERPRATVAILSVLSQLGYAMPVFFLGFLLLFIFAYELTILPFSPPQWMTGDVTSDPAALVLPILTLSLITMAKFTRYLSGEVASNMRQDYVVTAMAKGADERRILYRHVLRNSLVPIINLLGLQFPTILWVECVNESVFSYPGLGNTLLGSAEGRDFYTALGILLIAGLMTVLATLVADVLQAAADPRIRYTSGLQ